MQPPGAEEVVAALVEEVVVVEALVEVVVVVEALVEVTRVVLVLLALVEDGTALLLLPTPVEPLQEKTAGPGMM